MGKFGQNVISSDGDDWARQRRIFAPSISERISEGVWDEAWRQCDQMVAYMLGADGETKQQRDTPASLRAIAVNTLGKVGYGTTKPFEPFVPPRDKTADMRYIDVVTLMGELLVLAVLVPSWLLRMRWMPEFIQTLGVAIDKFPGLTNEMLEERRTRKAGVDENGAGLPKQGQQLDEDFMSKLVRLSDEAKAGSSGGQYLTEDEIRGNLLLFTVGGLDTTGTALNYTFALLAAYPQWQAWMQEEIDAVLGESETKNYSTLFPKLSRCLAVMVETLRIHPPLSHIGRSMPKSLIVTVNDSSHLLQAPMICYINNAALHTCPSVWGDDALEFRPSRWIAPADSAGGSRPGHERVLDAPHKWSYNAWSAGPRSCPGQKMSQVEFVTVLAAVFSQCNIEPAPRRGESMEQARERFVEISKETQLRVTVEMTRTAELGFRWVKR